jgi:nicotinate-nucleotide pyrophosphorylase (carboxylating)
MNHLIIEEYLIHALAEDVGDGDVTSLACIPDGRISKAKLIVKAEGVIAGVEVAKRIFALVDDSLKLKIEINDEAHVKVGDIAFYVEGNAQSILKAERLVLNCMQRMSGIATKTNQLVQLIKDYKSKVLDTRKTTPNFRMFEKMAVKIGGGFNHRFGLYDMILIKDNHVDFAGGISNAINAANEFLNKSGKDLQIEIEARNLDEVKEILSIRKINRILLDNFSIPDIKTAVDLISGKFETEASGNITSQNIVDYAKCGVDFISMGALTHSYSSLDLSLKAYKD